MKKFLYKKAFLRDFDHHKELEKELIIMADKQIRHYYLKQRASFGLRIKKLFENKDWKVFEARVSNKIRLLYVESEEVVAFVFLGNHDEVKKYIKKYK